MSTTNLPPGFVLDAPKKVTSLPPGFVLDKPDQEMVRGVFGDVPRADYEQGKRNWLGSITDPPGAASREAIKAGLKYGNPALALAGPAAGIIALKDQAQDPRIKKAATDALMNPSLSKTFVEESQKKNYGNDNMTTGLTSDIAALGYDAIVDPTTALGTIIGLSPVGKSLPYARKIATLRSRENLGEVVGGTRVGQAVGRFLTKERVIPKPAPKAEKLSKEATGIYRDILRPTQGEVKNVEIKLGKDIDKYYKLAAEEGLPIGKTSDNKLDTKQAIQSLKPKIQEIHNQLNNLLKSDQSQFDLLEIGEKAKSGLSKANKTAKDIEVMKSQVDEYIQAEIQRYGQIVNARTLNDIKQGMWGVGYDQLKPTAKETARQIGHIARGEIESKFPRGTIRDLNAKSGEYQTLTDLLENADGRVIKGGRLGGYFARILGSGTGALLGTPLPGVGPAIGSVAGGETGARLASFLNNPVRRSAQATAKMAKSRLLRPIESKGIIPEILPRQQKVSGRGLLPGKERLGLPSPKDVKYNPSQHRVMEKGKPMGFEGSGETIPLGVSDETRNMMDRLSQIKNEEEIRKRLIDLVNKRPDAANIVYSDLPENVKFIIRKGW